MAKAEKDQTTKDPRPIIIDGHAQGTTYHIIYCATDSIVTKSQIDSILDNLDASMSLYKPHSEINTFNESAEGVKIDEHFQTVIKRSLTIYRETGGIFDITVKPLVQAWGFGPKPITEIPDSAAIKAILPCIGSDKLSLKGDSLKKSNPCVTIDVNGIAQGYSVDVIADFLEKQHIRNYLVELGGEIRVRGRKIPGKERMRIGIETPSGDDFQPTPLQKIIQPDKGAVTTSGNYRKYYMSGTRKISHLIDPHTGYPLDNEMISVTVYSKKGIISDGYDNALMGMGLDGALRFLEHRKDLAAYLIYHRPDGSIADTATTNFPLFLAK